MWLYYLWNELMLALQVYAQMKIVLTGMSTSILKLQFVRASSKAIVLTVTCATRSTRMCVLSML